VQKISNKYT